LAVGVEVVMEVDLRRGTSARHSLSYGRGKEERCSKDAHTHWAYPFQSCGREIVKKVGGEIKSMGKGGWWACKTVVVVGRQFD